MTFERTTEERRRKSEERANEGFANSLPSPCLGGSYVTTCSLVAFYELCREDVKLENSSNSNSSN